MGAPPGELRDMTLNELRISVGGATLTGSGSADFAPGPIPMPVGSVDLQLSGRQRSAGPAAGRGAFADGAARDGARDARGLRAARCHARHAGIDHRIHRRRRHPGQRGFHCSNAPPPIHPAPLRAGRGSACLRGGQDSTRSGASSGTKVPPRMSQPLASLTDALLEAATRAGAEAADAIAVDGTSLSIGVRAGALEQAERSEGVEIGLRVMVGARQACVSASDTRPETVARDGRAGRCPWRGWPPEDPTVGLADPAQLSAVARWPRARHVGPGCRPRPRGAGGCRAPGRSRGAGREGRRPGAIGQARAFRRRRVQIAATNGFSGGYERSDHGLGCVAITGEGWGWSATISATGETTPPT